MDHEAKGAIASQAEVRRMKNIAKADVVLGLRRAAKAIAARKAATTGRVGELVKPPAEQERSSAPGSHPVVSADGLDHHGGSNPPPIPTKPSMMDLVRRIIPSGGSSAVERRPSKPMVEGSTPSPRSKKSAASPKAKDRPLRGKALSQDSAIALSPSGPADGDVIVVDDLDEPPPTEAQRRALLKFVTKKRKPRMTQPTDKPAKPPRGRPKTVADRKAYKAEKERLRRAKLKANQP